MEVTFTNPGIEYMLESIMGFQKEETTNFWSEPLYYFYPQLDKEYAQGLSLDMRREYIGKVMKEAYNELHDTIEDKVLAYTQCWKTYQGQIEDALSEAFDVDCSKLFLDMKCNISLNPIAPRYLKEHSFDVFYLNSEKGAIGQMLHEIIHFVWFYVWNKNFRDSYDEYESPTMKWILSEMVVESIMRDERLSSINPYFPREAGGCIYPYFFTMSVNGENVLDVIDEMYRTKSISEFMKNSYEYCLKYESEIRAHIKHSEG